MKNKEIASLFSRIADALEIKGELAFKVLACRKAAATLEDLGQDIEALAVEEKLQTVPGIGRHNGAALHPPPSGAGERGLGGKGLRSVSR
jgi:DNA polymerase (family 10)